MNAIEAAIEHDGAEAPAHATHTPSFFALFVGSMGVVCPQLNAGVRAGQPAVLFPKTVSAPCDAMGVRLDPGR